MTASQPRSYGPRTSPAISLNNDYSANQVGIGGLQLVATIPVNANRIGYAVQNQSTTVITVALDDGVSSTPTYFLLNPNSSGQAGDALDMLALPHYGRIRVYSSSSTAPVAAVDW